VNLDWRQRIRESARVEWAAGRPRPVRAVSPDPRDRVPVLVRLRTEADEEECLRLAEAVRLADGYPVHVAGSLRDFLVSQDAIRAWVAVRGEEIVGHVALHRRSSDAVVEFASGQLDWPADRLGVVARLLVAPDARRQGLGRLLLATAEQEALARGLRPVLDVVVTHRMAIQLYEACGWVRAGAVTSRLRDGTELEEIVYFGPPSEPA
jgi:GNAT superfamily N-acetyltransferase